MAATVAARDRSEDLNFVTAPTLVIHGSEDPLIPLELGEATAKAVPEAEQLIIEGMGHGLPPQVWPLIVEAIAAHTRKADQ
jgi:pimeloyl-ACP methyl ester carboxylesterase